MSYSDAIARVSQIQRERSVLPTTLDRAKAGASSFADALAEAQAGDSALVEGQAGDSALPTASGASMLSGVQGLPTQGLETAGLSTQAQPASTGVPLTSGQQQFASRLSEETGLDPQVISSWLLAEESGGAAQSRQQANNNDWLNIGYTDSATYGSDDSVWSNPVTAAEATAGWLQGQDTIPGYGTASSGVQAILNTAGQPAGAQIAAIQGSGWASSGYPDLPALYQQVAG
jgi:hypothetical protein